MIRAPHWSRRDKCNHGGCPPQTSNDIRRQRRRFWSDIRKLEQMFFEFMATQELRRSIQKGLQRVFNQFLMVYRRFRFIPFAFRHSLIPVFPHAPYLSVTVYVVRVPAADPHRRKILGFSCGDLHLFRPFIILWSLRFHRKVDGLFSKHYLY